MPWNRGTKQHLPLGSGAVLDVGKKPSLPIRLLNVLVGAVLAVLGALHLNAPNRIVIALSPFFVSAAGTISALVAHYLPFLGKHLSTGELYGVFMTGSAFAAGKILMWLKGWHAHEEALNTPSALPFGTFGTTLGSAELLANPSPRNIPVTRLHSVPDPARELLGHDHVPTLSEPAGDPPREVGLPD